MFLGLIAAAVCALPVGARCTGGEATAEPPADVAVRGGQITPSQLRSLHLKSGALGFRFPSRLSHIAPPHLGQSGTADESDDMGSGMRRGG